MTPAQSHFPLSTFAGLAVPVSVPGLLEWGKAVVNGGLWELTGVVSSSSLAVLLHTVCAC